MSLTLALAAHRFGLGPRPGDLAARHDTLEWLDTQIDPQAALLTASAAHTSKDALNALKSLRAHRKSLRSGQITPDAQAALKRMIKSQSGGLLRDIKRRLNHAAQTDQPFAERWVRFWSNHFTVAATRPETIGLAGPFEREAIRPHVFGSFETLLTSAVLHPGMLLYLDNHRSIGPSTRLANRRGLGLNENLAREVLELHTLGVGGGYGQSDVEALAKALTGWMPFKPRALRASVTGGGMFVSIAHEPGAKILLGKRYSSDGAVEAKAMLTDLATAPATARHLAHKLVRHFISDTPPAAAVTALARVFEETGGNLAALARALIRLDGAFDTPLEKVKTPEELMIASARALGHSAVFSQARSVLKGLGQRPLGAPSPAGWSDLSKDWMSADALQKRMDWASAVARRTRADPLQFIEVALGPQASAALTKAVARAGSPAQGLTPALMSPAFQRR